MYCVSFKTVTRGRRGFFIAVVQLKYKSNHCSLLHMPFLGWRLFYLPTVLAFQSSDFHYHSYVLPSVLLSERTFSCLLVHHDKETNKTKLQIVNRFFVPLLISALRNVQNLRETVENLTSLL